MRAFLLALFFTFLTADAWAADATASLIAELVGIDQEIRDTDWHFNNRAEKKALEQRANLVRQILGRISEYETSLVGCGAIIRPDRRTGLNRPVTVIVPRSASSTEVQLIERIVRLDDQIENGDWGWHNRDEKKALEEGLKHAREALRAIKIGMCDDHRSLTIVPR